MSFTSDGRDLMRNESVEVCRVILEWHAKLLVKTVALELYMYMSVTYLVILENLVLTKSSPTIRQKTLHVHSPLRIKKIL